MKRVSIPVHSPPVARRWLVAIALLAVFVAALPSPTARAQAAPSVAIVSPPNGSVIGNGGPVMVVFQVTDFVLVQPGRVGQVNSSTQGHVAVSADGQWVRVMTRVEPIVLTLDSGPHLIELELERSDYQPLTPAVKASLQVTVTHGPASGNPGVRIAFPETGYSSGHDVYVAVVLSNFTLVEPRGRRNAPNEGHLQVLLGGALQQELSRYEPAFVVDMPDGDNAITVRLVNNDGTPLTPDVAATTTIYVKPATATLPEILNVGVTVLLIYILIVLVLRRRKAAQKAAALPKEE